MSRERRSNIKKLVLEWERGVVKTSKQLYEMGYSSQLLSKYVKNRWLEKVGKQGAYKLYGDKIKWIGALLTIQEYMKKRIHVGGKTALTLMGLSHYAAQSIDTILLYTKRDESLPEWMIKQQFDVAILTFHTEFLSDQSFLGFTDYIEGDIKVWISSPERAILEMLYLVPKRHTFEESFLIMENLTSLRATVLQNLLEKCNSIKVKRMFLYMASRLGYAWFKQLKVERIDLGRGKRVIVEGGEFDKEYQITVPLKNSEEVGY